MDSILKIQSGTCMVVEPLGPTDEMGLTQKGHTIAGVNGI
jgi:hypothetical protein